MLRIERFMAEKYLVPAPGSLVRIQNIYEFSFELAEIFKFKV
jgi:hypothetical protein